MYLQVEETARIFKIEKKKTKTKNMCIYKMKTAVMVIKLSTTSWQVRKEHLLETARKRNKKKSRKKIKKKNI